MIFGGISLKWKTPFISIQGNINSHVYFDDCIDGAEIIPNMNQIWKSKLGLCSRWSNESHLI